MPRISAPLLIVTWLIALPTLAAVDVEGVQLPEMPEWARDSLYSRTYLDIDKVMAAESVSRFEAVEIQNRLRDRLEHSLSTAIADVYRIMPVPSSTALPMVTNW